MYCEYNVKIFDVDGYNLGTKGSGEIHSPGLFYRIFVSGGHNPAA